MKKIIFFIFALLAGLATFAQSLAIVTTDSITNITKTSAIVYFHLANNGNDPNTIGGFCYGTPPNPTLTNQNVATVSPLLVDMFFPITIKRLSAGTTYYVRAYSKNSAGTYYGNQLQFTTAKPTLPEITTDSVLEVTATTATVSESVKDDGGSLNLKFDFCCSKSPNPTIADSMILALFDSCISESCTKELVSLTPKTTYYVRAYATNMAGTVYGRQLQFTTGHATAAIVTTDSIINVTGATAVVYGSKASNGNDPETSTGFCYNTSPNPTIENDKVMAFNYLFPALTHFDSLGLGSFHTTLSGLSLNTTYYVRSYATNIAGTSYGSQMQFTTGDCYAYYTTTYDSVQNMFTLTIDPETVNLATTYYWDFGDGGSSTQATPTHTFIADTTYNVCLKITVADNNACSYCSIIGKDSKGKIYRTSGFTMKAVYAATENILVFPNPFNNHLSIVTSKPSSIKITSISGTEVYNTNVNAGKSTIDTNGFSSGVYFITITNEQTTVTKKLVKD